MASESNAFNDPADARPPRLAVGMWKRFAIAAVVIVLLSAAVATTWALEIVKQVADNLALGGPQIKSAALFNPGPPTQPETILVVGSDKRARSTIAQDRADPPHTDTMLLIRFDPTSGQTSILSIPRDLEVDLPGYGINKINAAYSFGGTQLMLRTLRQVLPAIRINEVVDVNFAAFRAIVDTVGCIYIDVDQRYFHANAGTIASNYSAINLQPGYQRLCGNDALAYVRYRHTDSDFVRVARQQDFLRQLRQQVGVNALLQHYNALSRDIGREITTSIRGPGKVLDLVKLLAFSLSKPVRQVPFVTDNVNLLINGGSYVTASPYDIQQTENDFLHGRERFLAPPSTHAGSRSGGGRGRHHHAAPAAPASSLGLYAAPSFERDAALGAAHHLPFRLLYPSLKTGPAIQQQVRWYDIYDEQYNRHHAYRIVWQQNGLGGYYGLEGMDWTNPPIVAHPDQTRTIDGRTYLFFTSGAKLHMIAWRRGNALYWLSNTLLDNLTGEQMLAIARSVQPLR